MSGIVVVQGENEMTTQAITPRNTLFKVGWSALLLVSLLMTLLHLLLLFTLNEAPLFSGWTAFNLYATLVLWFPFRRGETWAWCISWVLVIAFASAIFFNPQIGPFYLGLAVIMAVGLLLTASAFFPRNRGAEPGSDQT
jgi:hypothetical protein